MLLQRQQLKSILDHFELYQVTPVQIITKVTPKEDESIYQQAIKIF